MKPVEPLLLDTNVLLHLVRGKEVGERIDRMFGLRARADTSADKLGAKIKAARLTRVPYVAVVGDKEVDLKLLKGYGKKKLDTDFSGMTGMIKMMNLLTGTEPPTRKSLASKIAVISAVGPITSGSSAMDFFGDSSMGSATMIKAIRQARDDATVKAIVLRVDSPGGSALASDLMWHELETVQKPFVVKHYGELEDAHVGIGELD